eukprot:4581481-Pyramimonas_sp.AAC.1
MVVTFGLPGWPKDYHQHQTLGSSFPGGGKPLVLVLVPIFQASKHEKAGVQECLTRGTWDGVVYCIIARASWFHAGPPPPPPPRNACLSGPSLSSREEPPQSLSIGNLA